MSRTIGWPIVIIASAAGAGLSMVSHLGLPIRPIITFWFLLVCPGMALIPLLHIEEHWIEFIAAIALSLALDALVSQAMLLARIWSPQWGLVALIGVSLGGAVLQISQSRYAMTKAEEEA